MNKEVTAFREHTLLVGGERTNKITQSTQSIINSMSEKHCEKTTQECGLQCWGAIINGVLRQTALSVSERDKEVTAPGTARLACLRKRRVPGAERRDRSRGRWKRPERYRAGAQPHRARED